MVQWGQLHRQSLTVVPALVSDLFLSVTVSLLVFSLSLDPRATDCGCLAAWSICNTRSLETLLRSIVWTTVTSRPAQGKEGGFNGLAGSILFLGPRLGWLTGFLPVLLLCFLAVCRHPS